MTARALSLPTVSHTLDRRITFGINYGHSEPQVSHRNLWKPFVVRQHFGEHEIPMNAQKRKPDYRMATNCSKATWAYGLLERGSTSRSQRDTGKGVYRTWRFGGQHLTQNFLEWFCLC